LRHCDGRAHAQRPAAGEDTLSWLAQALGNNDHQQLDQEFLTYLAQFPHESSAWLKMKKQ
jgi:hypothetical protein